MKPDKFNELMTAASAAEAAAAYPRRLNQNMRDAAYMILLIEQGHAHELRIEIADIRHGSNGQRAQLYSQTAQDWPDQPETKIGPFLVKALREYDRALQREFAEAPDSGFRKTPPQK
jgi:hypothetical protein